MLGRTVVTVVLLNLTSHSSPSGMRETDLKELYKGFSLSNSTKIYLREKEVHEIRSFPDSEQTVLHICGNPGTGKTYLSNKLLGTSALYLNYYSEADFMIKIKSSKKNIVIIDEFDKYYSEKRSECTRVMCYLRDNSIKLVTLSNDLRISADALFFRPYTSSDMEMILKQKLMEEPQVEMTTMTVIKLISKRMGLSGDLRLLFGYIREILENKLSKNDISMISMEDVTSEKENEPMSPNDVHHSIVSMLMLKDARVPRIELYSRYLKECMEMGIQPYDRADFNTVYDIYS